jgi:hypothetical protein
VGETKSATGVLVGNPKGKVPSGDLRYGGEPNIKTDDTQDRVLCMVRVKSAMILRLSRIAGIP